MKRIFVFCVGSLLAASLAFAQSTSTSTGSSSSDFVSKRVSFLTTLLSLTTPQQQQATTIFTNAATADQTAHAGLKTARQSLNTAITSNDVAGIDQAASTIGTLTAQTVATDAKAQAAFYQILTPDQQTKLNQLESQHHGFPGALGHGGFGPGDFHGGPH